MNIRLKRSLLACWCCISQIAVAQTQPNDPLFNSQWYLFSAADHRGQPGSINAVAAWEFIHPAEPITIAILGAGLNFTHPDLAENVWKNDKETQNLMDDDGNGFVDDINGWDFASNDNNPVSEPYSDNQDHDSMVASLIAAIPNNGIGICGIAVTFASCLFVLMATLRRSNALPTALSTQSIMAPE